MNKIILFSIILFSTSTLAEEIYQPDGTVSKTVATTTDSDGKKSVTEEITVNYTNRDYYREIALQKAKEAMVSLSDADRKRIQERPLFITLACSSLFRTLKSDPNEHINDYNLSSLNKRIDNCLEISQFRHERNSLLLEQEPMQLTQDMMLYQFYEENPDQVIHPVIMAVITGQISGEDAYKSLHQ